MNTTSDKLKKGLLWFTNNIDVLKPLTGMAILVVFVYYAIALTAIRIPEDNRELFIHFMGIVEGAFVGNLVNYYFGSSRSSATKDETISKIISKETPDEP